MNILEKPRLVEFKNATPASVRSASPECAPFNLQIPIDKNWDESKYRILIVCQHVHTDDLRNRALLSGPSYTVLNNCINYAKKLARNLDERVPSFAYAAINFNFFKTYHLSPAQQTDLHVDAICAKRVKLYIEKIKPTHIFISGNAAAHAILKNVIENVDYKMGWASDVEINGVPVKVGHSFDYITSIQQTKQRFVDDDDDDSDDSETSLAGAFLLGYFCRNLRNLLIGKIPFKISIVPKPVLIDDIDKFKLMMKKLERAPRVAFDSETKNLNRINNRLYVMQFATSAEKGYVLPYLHPDTPYNNKELKYIRKRLRKFFMRPMPDIDTGAKTYKCIYMFNGKFDLTQIRQQLGVRNIYWPVYDIRAGEFLLDENLRFLGTIAKANGKKMYHGGLAQLLCNYGEDFYYKADFGKSDRGDMDNTKITDKGFLKYCSVDVQSLFAMADSQLQRAKHDYYIENGDKNTYVKDFLVMNLCQMSNNIHTFSKMEHRGVPLDRRHLMYLKTKQSPISKAIMESTRELYKSDFIKKANARLLKQSEVKMKNTLFARKPWVFNVNKPEHKQVLFIEVMGLEPVTYGKSGKPSLGKLFKGTYKEINEVMLLNNLEKAKKLKSSYVDAFIKRMDEGDGAIDGRLRASFDFFPVVTGRSNSSDPSLQQIPQRGDNAKHIKRSFIASFGGLIIKQDYSAHEIRMWSVISGDRVLGDVFQIGRTLRQKFFKTGKRKYKDEIGLKGDVHKLNVNFFFGTPIEKVSKDERDQIKGVGFGAIYGKSYKTLARELKKAEDYMKELFDRFFGRFKRASGWLEWAKNFSEKHFFVKSILGRRRYLFGYLTENNRIVAAMKRRAMNSPIQGMGADLGHTAARIFSLELEKVLLKLKRIHDDDEDMPCDVEVMVHDSTRLISQFENMLVCIHLLQWCATKGVVNWYKKYHGFDFTVFPEVEMEFGADESHMYKWDWSIDAEPKEGDDAYSLKHCLTLAVADYKKIFVEDKRSEKEIMKLIFADWNNAKIKKYLDTNYPILPD